MRKILILFISVVLILSFSQSQTKKTAVIKRDTTITVSESETKIQINLLKAENQKLQNRINRNSRRSQGDKQKLDANLKIITRLETIINKSTIYVKLKK